MAEIEQLSKAFTKALSLSEDNEKVLASVDTKEFTDVQTAELHQWLTLSSRFPEEIPKLNEFLKSRTFLLEGAQSASVLDAIVLGRVVQHVKGWSNDQVVANRHVVRWADLIQNAVNVPADQKITVNVDLEAPREFKAKPEKKGGKKEEAAPSPAAPAPAADSEEKKDLPTQKKEKKKKEKKPQPPKEEVVITPGMIDLRVGWIEKAIKHPDADSLYVSTIHMGDEEGPRTVCSGLVKHFELEQMQDRMVVTVANLKPVNMRGIKSCGMVLCAANEETVEFVNPPQGAKAGDKIFFETYDLEPEKQLNPKKKIWEQIQPGFTTTDALEVVFKKDGEPDRKLVNKAGELCKVNTLVAADVR